MISNANFQQEFNRLATNGCIGDPNGEPAYAILRVSSEEQSDEGRSGLPRQIEHVHEVALKNQLRVPWELVFADDHTGFEFRDRPELSRLRKEYKGVGRRANAVLIENIDRLSRNADWHQGFLLDEMKEHGLKVIFWKQFGSRIERSVMGAIAQEGMEQAKTRMAEGNLYKARSNRVTARTPAYGYDLVDRYAQRSPEAKRDTHYAVNADEAEVVRIIYRKVGIEAWSLRKLAKWLDEHGYKPPQRARHWNIKTLVIILRNPVYKGEFYAHRHTEIKVPAATQYPNQPVKYAQKKIERPREEWIKVDAPPIVSSELWDMANRMLEKNRGTGRRNAKEPFLLTGFVKCARCGYSYIGNHRLVRKNGKEYKLCCYRCAGAVGMLGVFRDFHCTESQISCARLDTAVWKAVSDALLQPEILVAAVENGYASGSNAELQKEISLLEKQLNDSHSEDEDLYQAYRAKAFDADEFAERRRQVAERRRKIESNIADLKERAVTKGQMSLNAQKILAQSELLKQQGMVPNPPFLVKQRILKLVVDKIRLDVDGGWFEIEGLVLGHYVLDQDIVYTPEGRGSSPRPA